jgi:mannose-1-phosphate guanylyltransferase/mannose-6-phosphate isomerase
MSSKITPVILCGGSGTRLWPLSRKSYPKQFVPLVGGKSLLQATLERVRPLSDEVLAIGAEDHRFMVLDTLASVPMTGVVLLEPQARNTAAAMALAAVWLDTGGRGDELALFCPADHHIPDTRAFLDSVRAGVPAAQAGSLVTFGVVPTFPSTAYGYIQQGRDRGDGSAQVERFIEKPDAHSAAKLLLAGNVLWNAGIFLVRVSALLNALERHAPDILTACREAMASASQEQPPGLSACRFVRPDAQSFAACRAQSIDYAVMEPHDDVAVVPFTGGWSDVGSWNAVADLTAADDSGNRIVGQGVVHQARNTFVHAMHRPVVALGTSDLLVIDTPDAVLVAHRERAEQVKDVVALLEGASLPQAVVHRRVARPWGWYDSLEMGERFQVKRIGVKPGASLSLQKHFHRAEHWIVVKGTAEVTRGGATVLLKENESTFIPLGEVHRLRNPGSMELEVIEVQSGDYLGEDDIVRLEDGYGRAPERPSHG